MIGGASTRVVSLKMYWRQIAFATPIPKKGYLDNNAILEVSRSILKRELIYPSRFKSKFELVLEFHGIFTDIVMNAFTHTNKARQSNLLIRTNTQIIPI